MSNESASGISDVNPTIITPPQGHTVAVVGDVYRFLATGKDTNGKYALWEALVPPGGGPPPHVHSREEEGFYVLDGEITFTVNGERVVATAGADERVPTPWRCNSRANGATGIGRNGAADAAARICSQRFFTNSVRRTRPLMPS